jgi:hypothetical protein
MDDGRGSRPPVGSLARAEVKRFYPHQRPSNFIRPLPDLGLLYVKNPKAGTSTILGWLDRLHTSEPGHEFGNIHKEHRLPTLRELGWETVGEMLAGSAYRFSFVRHPLRRLESVYWDKIVHTPRMRPRFPELLGLPAPTSTLSFEAFLEAVERQDPVTEMNQHWRPQHVNLMHPLVTYDRVGRLESFDADLALIREEAGLPDVPAEVRNTSRRRTTDSVYEGRPDLVRRVEELYALDYELYGY